MKRLLVFVIFTASGLICSAQENADLIFWSSTKLSWDDFKQVYDRNKNLGHSSKIRWEFMFRINILNNTDKIGEILAGFNPKLSWVKPSSRGNLYLLNHEQLHFDLVELYARKLRRLLYGRILNKKSDQRAALRVKRKMYLELLSIQRKYDLDTQNSLNLERQQWWDNDVAKELDELSMFSFVK